MRAKLITGQLKYFQQPSWILGDATSYAIEQGYKEVKNTTGNNGVWEDEEFIYVETPEVTLSPEKQREDAYANELIIEWSGEFLTCDNARINRMSVYFYSEQMDKYEDLKALWLAARNEIQNRYPG